MGISLFFPDYAVGFLFFIRNEVNEIPDISILGDVVGIAAAYYKNSRKICCVKNISVLQVRRDNSVSSIRTKTNKNNTISFKKKRNHIKSYVS